jgi:hypothetical protein
MATAANIGIGAIPILGQVADARDTVAALKGVWDEPGSWGSWGRLGLAAVGWVPVAGDAIKGAVKAGRKAGQEVAEDALEKTAKELTDTAEEIAEKELKETVERGTANAVEQVVQDAPQFTKIGGKRMKSWVRDTLVGTSAEQFRKNAQAIIRNQPDHPLRKLLDKSGNFMSSTAKGVDQVDWLSNPAFVEAGHVTSRKSGEAEKLILMSTHKNRFLSSTIEHPKGGAAFFELPGQALSIGGIAVDLELAADLVRAKLLDAEVLKTAELITF